MSGQTDGGTSSAPDGAGNGARRRGERPRCTIAHISDIHCGSPHFQPDLLERAIEEINVLQPDITIVSGDLTTDGYRPEYEMAREYLAKIECQDKIVVPGNHDSRNVGYIHFEEIFGSRTCVMHRERVSIVALDSSEPDLDHGQIGRNRYPYIEEHFSQPADLRVFVIHHHLLPVPGTGRERNIVYDAGDLLEVLLRAEVNLVLCGHKHVPYAWKLEDMFVVSAGTVSTLRVRGHTRPCYNIVEIDSDRVSVLRKYPFDQREMIVEFSPLTAQYRKAEEFRKGEAAPRRTEFREGVG
jgi:3',5'-cyclic-AMP phosphodiesterase